MSLTLESLRLEALKFVEEHYGSVDLHETIKDADVVAKYLETGVVPTALDDEDEDPPEPGHLFGQH